MDTNKPGTMKAPKVPASGSALWGVLNKSVGMQMREMIAQLNQDLIEYGWFLKVKENAGCSDIISKIESRLKDELDVDGATDLNVSFKRECDLVTKRVLSHLGFTMGTPLLYDGQPTPAPLEEASIVRSLALLLCELHDDQTGNVVFLEAECDRYFNNRRSMQALIYKQSFARLYSLDTELLKGVLKLFEKFEHHAQQGTNQSPLLRQVLQTGCQSSAVEYLLSLAPCASEKYEQFFVDAYTIAVIRTSCIYELHQEWLDDWKKNGDVGAVDSETLPRLIQQAVTDRDYGTLKALAESLNGVIYDDGSTPLLQAVEADDFQTVSTLLELGVKTECEGSTPPLHIACKKGYWLTAMLLVEAGANIGVLERGSFDPISHVVTHTEPDLDLVHLLAQKSLLDPQLTAHTLNVAAQNDIQDSARVVLQNVLANSGAGGTGALLERGQ